MKISALFSIIMLTCIATVFAQPPVLIVQLDEAEQQALDYSPQLKAAQWETKAAHASATSQSALLWPRLSLEGNVRYITEVPEIEIALPIPNVDPMVMTMGDNLNYSVGLQLGWQLWDSFAIRGTVAAMEKQAEGHALKTKALKEDVVLKTRLAYLQTQLALEQINLFQEALRLAQAQNKDIQAKARAGASSKIDRLSSQLNVTERKKQLREARTNLSEALRQLMSLTGQSLTVDIQLPLGKNTSQRVIKGIKPATVLVQLDDMEQTKQKLSVKSSKAELHQHPNTQAMIKTIEAAEHAVRSTAARYWPVITTYVKSSLDYPNQVVLEQVQQNSAGASLSWTLWQRGRTGDQVKMQKAGVEAAQHAKAQLENSLALIWDKAQDRVTQLEDVQELNRQTESDAQSLARLIYEAYLAGRVNYLDVQSANLKALQASTQVVVTETQLMIQLALLNSL